MLRNRFKQTTSLNECLKVMAKAARDKARLLLPGNDWLKSSELRPPT